MRPRDVRKLPEVTQPQSAPRSGPNPSFLQTPLRTSPSLPSPPLPAHLRKLLVESRSLGQEDRLEKGQATHPSILAWRIPWTVQSTGSQRVGPNRATSTFTFPSLWQTAGCAEVSHSVMADSLRPHRLQPARLLCPWDSPGKNTGVGCHALLQGIFPGLPHCRQSL